MSAAARVERHQTEETYHGKAGANGVSGVPKALLSDVAPFCGLFSFCFVLAQLGDRLGGMQEGVGTDAGDAQGQSGREERHCEVAKR